MFFLSSFLLEARFVLGGKILPLGNKQKKWDCDLYNGFLWKKWPKFTMRACSFHIPFFSHFKQNYRNEKTQHPSFLEGMWEKVKQHQYGDNPFVKRTTKTHLLTRRASLSCCCGVVCCVTSLDSSWLIGMTRVQSSEVQNIRHMDKGILNSAYLQGSNLVCTKSSTILLTCERGWVGEMGNFLSVFEEHLVFVNILSRKDEGSYT